MKLLHSSTDTSRFFHTIDVPLQYSALMFKISGTMGATAFKLYDIGRLTYRIRNNLVVDYDYDYAAHLTNVIAGACVVTDPSVSADFNLAVLIPRFWLDDNVEYVTKDDKATFEIVFGAAVASYVASGFLCELYALPDEGIQAYNLKIIQQGLSYAGAGYYSENFSTVENIASVFCSARVSNVLTTTGSNIDRLDYTIGDKSGNFSLAAGLQLTQMKNQIETAGYAFMTEVFSAEVGDLNARLDDDITVKFDLSGASYPQVLLVGYDFNPNKVVETAAKLQNRYQFHINQKTAANKTRSISTLNALSLIGAKE